LPEEELGVDHRPSIGFPGMSGDRDSPLGRAIDWSPVPRPTREPLRGRFVLVRPLDAAADTQALYEVSHPPAGDSGIWTYLPDGPYPSAEALCEVLKAMQEMDDPLFFTLVRLPEGRPQGAASYLRITPEHGVIEIGHIWFGTPLQRTAAATEAIFLLIRHAFDDLGYRRLEWKCNALNQGSRRAAERFGLHFEGIFRQHLVIKGRSRATAWYALTDEEWPAVRSGFEAWLAEDNFDDGVQRRTLGELIAEARAAT
jgi:RimJ/RimL family protein N-acetyltransferase